MDYFFYQWRALLYFPIKMFFINMFQAHVKGYVRYIFGIVF